MAQNSNRTSRTPEVPATPKAPEEPQVQKRPALAVPTQGTSPSEAEHVSGVLTALGHLTTLKQSLSMLEAHASHAMLEPHLALHSQMRRLVMEDPTYRDAAALLFLGVRLQ